MEFCRFSEMTKIFIVVFLTVAAARLSAGGVKSLDGGDIQYDTLEYRESGVGCGPVECILLDMSNRTARVTVYNSLNDKENGEPARDGTLRRPAFNRWTWKFIEDELRACRFAAWADNYDYWYINDPGDSTQWELSLRKDGRVVKRISGLHDGPQELEHFLAIKEQLMARCWGCNTQFRESLKKTAKLREVVRFLQGLGIKNPGWGSVNDARWGEIGYCVGQYGQEKECALTSLVSVGDSAEIPKVVDGRRVAILLRSAIKDKGKLETLVVPDTVRLICGDSFRACPNLKRVVFRGDMPSVVGDVSCFLPEKCSIAYVKGKSGWDNCSGTVFDLRRRECIEEEPG